MERDEIEKKLKNLKLNSGSIIEEIIRLVMDTGVTDINLILNDALSVYQDAISGIKKGKILAIVDEHNLSYSEIKTDILEEVKKRKKMMN